MYGGNLATPATANVMYEYSSVCAGVTPINVQVVEVCYPNNEAASFCTTTKFPAPLVTFSPRRQWERGPRQLGQGWRYFFLIHDKVILFLQWLILEKNQVKGGVMRSLASLLVTKEP